MNRDREPRVVSDPPMESTPSRPVDPLLMEATQLMTRTHSGDHEAFGELVRLVGRRAQRRSAKPKC